MGSEMRRPLYIALLFFAWGIHTAAAQTGWRHAGLIRVSHSGFRASLFNPDRMATRCLEMPRQTAQGIHQLRFHGRQGRFSLQAAGLTEVKQDTDWEAAFQLAEAVVSVEAGNCVFMAGRAMTRWGTGYAFNPTDFMAPAKRLSDPENRDGTALGRDMVKAEYFTENLSMAVGAVLPVTGNFKTRIEHPAMVTRVYTHVLGVDLSFLGRLQHSEKAQWGVNLAYVIGDRLELHAEAKGSADREQHAVMAGFQMTLPCGLLLIGEAWHEAGGLSGRQWTERIHAAEQAEAAWRMSPSSLTEGRILSQLSVFQGGRAMQNYGFLHLQRPIRSVLELRLTVMMNLHDTSRIVLPEIEWTRGNRFTFFMRGAIFTGSARSEYGAHFYSHSIEGGVRFHG